MPISRKKKGMQDTQFANYLIVLAELILTICIWKLYDNWPPKRKK